MNVLIQTATIKTWVKKMVNWCVVDVAPLSMTQIWCLKSLLERHLTVAMYYMELTSVLIKRLQDLVVRVQAEYPVKWTVETLQRRLVSQNQLHVLTYKG